jgi:CheY-like chemotaxis protein
MYMAGRIILSVEDDDSAFYLLRTAFAEAAPNIDLQRASDGDQALSMLREAERTKPDLILLNLNLPKRNGFELLEEMKGDDLIGSIPAVVFSSSALSTDKARCLALGVKYFYTKPNTFEGYISTAQSICALLQ